MGEEILSDDEKLFEKKLECAKCDALRGNVGKKKKKDHPFWIGVKI
jgi:hypothetical protein